MAGSSGGAEAARLHIGVEYDPKLTNLASYVESQLKAADEVANTHKIKVGRNVDTSGMERSLKSGTERATKSAGKMVEQYGPGRVITEQFVQAENSAQKSTKSVSKAMARGSKDFASATRQTVNAISNGEKNLNKWSKAQTGKTSDAWYGYKGHIENLRSLMSELDEETMSKADFRTKFADIQRGMKLYESEMVAAGEATQTFGDRMSGAFSRLGRYVAASTVIYQGIRAVKEMASASIEVESAMNRIQIVTGASDREMSGFFTTASTQARELGKSITDVAGSIETFSRLGYNLKDAAELSKYATIMSNVGDTDVDSATTGITSIIKGYNLNPGDAERVSDVLVTVGKNYAISAEELMTAFERGGAALSASGTDFEKSAALFAATNASLQNAQMTGTMWKTVSARIRGATTELEEMGEDTTGLAEGLSKYRDEIKALSGVDIMKNENEYKDMYDIFTELAHVWDNINGDEAKARVAEILGGTRQLSGIMSTITNIKDAEGAYADAMNSAGESSKANDKYMETTAAHLGQLKATFQEFSSDFMDSTFLKGAVDAGNAILKILDTIIDKIGVLGTAAAGVGLFKLIKGVKSGSGLKSILSGLGSYAVSKRAPATNYPVWDDIRSGLGVETATHGMAYNALSGLKMKTTEKLGEGFKKLGGAMGVTAGQAALLTGAFAALAVGAGVAVKLVEDYYHQFDKAQEKANESISKYEETQSKLESINSEIDANQKEIGELRKNKNLGVDDQKRLDDLEHENWQLERQKALYENLSDVQSKAAADAAKNALSQKTRESLTESDASEASFRKGSRFAPASRQANVKKVSARTPLEEIENYNKEIERAQSSLDATLRDKAATSSSDEKKLKEIEKSITKQQKDITELTDKRAKLIDKISPDIEAIRNENPDDIDVAKFDGLIGQITAKTTSDKINAFLSSNLGIKEYLQNAADAGVNLEDALNGIGLSLQDVGASSLKELEQQFNNTANSANKAADSVSNFRKDVKDVEDATESENQDKNWATIQQAYSAAKEMNKIGKTGTDDYQTITQLLSPKNLEKAAQKMIKAGGYASEAYQKEFERVMPIANRWLGENEENSVDNFIKDFQKKGLFDVTTDSKGLWHLATNFETTAEAAEKFGVSAQLVDTMLDSLEAYGYDFEQEGRKVEKSGELLSNYGSNLEKLKELRDSMDYGESRDKLDTKITGFDEAYELYQKDLTKLDEDAVVHIKFEYDLASIQQNIDEIRSLIEGGDNSVENNARLIAEQGNYITTAEKGLGLDKEGVKIPVEYEAVKGSIEDTMEQMQNATGDKKIELQAEVENQQQLLMQLQNAFASAHPEINANSNIDEVNSAWQEFMANDGRTIVANANVNGMDSVQTLLKTILGIPPNTQASVTATTSGEDAVTRLKNAIAGVTSKVVSIGAQFLGIGGKGKISGTAHMRGTAFANGNTSGDWRTHDSGVALGGELGPEMVVRDGRWFTIGGDSAEFFRYKKNDVIFDANQTAQLLGRGRITSGSRRASAFAEGTAFLRPGSTGSGSGSTSGTGKDTGKGKKDDKKQESALDKFKKWFAKLFDWIEVRLDRQAKKIERLTHKAERASKAGRDSAAETYYKQAASAQSQQLRNAALGEARYDKQANAVLRKAMKMKNSKGKHLLTAKQAKSIRTKVANGTINISSYSEKMQEIIKDYKTWYDKARDAEAQITEMADAISESYKAIAAAHREAAESEASLSKQMSGNASSASDKNKYLQSAVEAIAKIPESDQEAIDNLNSVVDKKGNAVINAGTKRSSAKKKTKKVVTKKDPKTGKKRAVVKTITKAVTPKGNAIKTTSKAYKKLSKKSKNKITKAINKAKSDAKNGKLISNISTLASYYKKGYITASFYNSCVQYNATKTSAKDAIAEMEAQKKIDIENAKAEKISAGSEMLENVIAEQERKVRQKELAYERASINKTALEAQQALKTTQGYELTESDYKDLKNKTSAQTDALNEQKKALEAERAAIEEQIEKNKDVLKYWDESTPEYIEAQNDLKEKDNQILELTNDLTDLAQAQEEYNNAIHDLAYTAIEKSLEFLDAVAAYNESLSSLRKAQGKDLSTSDYTKQIEDNNKKIEKYTSQSIAAAQDLAIANANGGYYAGKTAHDYEVMYYEALKSINELKEANEGLIDDMRDDVYWRTFERAHDSAQRLLDVISGIADLISDDMYFRDGSLTDFGMSQISNLTKQYELARKEVQNYSNDITNLNNLYAKGLYTTEEYKEKLAELQGGLLGAAKDMKGYIDSIISMYKELDQSELDALFRLIDKRNEALNAKKEYYDYDKTLRGKTKDIQELTAQIAALEGINTAEAKAQRAKLQEQLSEAQEDLEDTERDHYFSMMQDALADMKDTLQDQFDDKWKYLSQDLAKITDLMVAANELAAENADRIEETLTNLLSFYGVNSNQLKPFDEQHASGAKRINGRHIGLSNEKGSELLVTKYGLISRFNPGDGVVPADLTERLYNLAQSVKPGSSLGRPNIGKISPSSGITINQNYDSMLNIEGSADAATVSDLKRMSKDLLEKSYDYTSKRIQHDYTRTGGLRRA